MKTASKSTARSMSDAAVHAKTGRTWPEWFALLDADGAKKLPHKEIALHLRQEYGVGAWWCQMVTVEYERARGLREKHQTAAGYVANRSMTFPVPVEALYAAWSNARRRAKWLAEKEFTIRKATEPKSMRITWSDGTGVEVMFYPKGQSKSQVAVQHSKLTSRKQVDQIKKYWGERLTALAAVLAS